MEQIIIIVNQLLKMILYMAVILAGAEFLWGN